MNFRKISSIILFQCVIFSSMLAMNKSIADMVSLSALESSLKYNINSVDLDLKNPAVFGLRFSQQEQNLDRTLHEAYSLMTYNPDLAQKNVYHRFENFIKFIDLNSKTELRTTDQQYEIALNYKKVLDFFAKSGNKVKIIECWQGILKLSDKEDQRIKQLKKPIEDFLEKNEWRFAYEFFNEYYLACFNNKSDFQLNEPLRTFAQDSDSGILLYLRHIKNSNITLKDLFELIANKQKLTTDTSEGRYQEKLFLKFARIKEINSKKRNFFLGSCFSLSGLVGSVFLNRYHFFEKNNSMLPALAGCSFISFLGLARNFNKILNEALWINSSPALQACGDAAVEWIKTHIKK